LSEGKLDGASTLPPSPPWGGIEGGGLLRKNEGGGALKNNEGSAVRLKNIGWRQTRG